MSTATGKPLNFETRVLVCSHRGVNLSVNHAAAIVACECRQASMLLRVKVSTVDEGAAPVVEGQLPSNPGSFASLRSQRFSGISFLVFAESAAVRGRGEPPQREAAEVARQGAMAEVGVEDAQRRVAEGAPPTGVPLGESHRKVRPDRRPRGLTEATPLALMELKLRLLIRALPPIAAAGAGKRDVALRWLGECEPQSGELAEDVRTDEAVPGARVTRASRKDAGDRVTPDTLCAAGGGVGGNGEHCAKQRRHTDGAVPMAHVELSSPFGGVLCLCLKWVESSSVAVGLGVAVTLLGLLSLFALPLLLVRIPADYFVRDTAPPCRGTASWFGRMAKNLVGGVLLLMGVVMLVLPGQGLLTILAALVLLEFPGKRRFERWLIARPKVYKALNSMRARLGRPPLQLESTLPPDSSRGATG